MDMRKLELLFICLLVSFNGFSQGKISRGVRSTDQSGVVKATHSNNTKSATETAGTTMRPASVKQTQTSRIPQKTVLPHTPTAQVTRFSVKGVTFDMVSVEGGAFYMGGTGSAATDNEKPLHSEYVSSFLIGKTEVTQELWMAVMGSNPSYTKGDKLPVENVSWNDCKEFVDALNKLTGNNFRLPTEAEWEYAARGGKETHGYVYSGSNNPTDVAWYDTNSGGKTHAVATKYSNELGIYDMSGNVYEWTSSPWRYNYDSAENERQRVRRGGSFLIGSNSCRVSHRDTHTLYFKGSYIGLRLALSKRQASTASGVTSKSDVSYAVTTVGTRYSVKGVKFEMINVKGGSFRMGNDASDAKSVEKPVHEETVSSFQIGKTEVTQALWKAIMGSNPSRFEGDDLPVENVTWNDCQEFVKKISQLTGMNFRLPTEVEWEYAARGGASSRAYKYSGSNSVDDVAWYFGNTGGKTYVVSSKSPNNLGLYDMSGNVWEWTSSPWCADYSSSKDYTKRVRRGGSSLSYDWATRVTLRFGEDLTFKYEDLGLRLAL